MANKDVAFETLGRIVVDLDALDKSLNAAEVRARSHGKVLQRIWDESSRPAAGQMGLGDAGVQGDMGRADSAFGSAAKAASAARTKRVADMRAALFGTEDTVPPGLEKTVKSMENAARGAGATGSSFGHLARVASGTLVPALSQISPEMANFVSGAASAARVAMVLGGAVGAAVVVANVLSTAIGKYAKIAQDATAAQVDMNQAIATMDASRAEIGVRKVTEEIAAWGVTVKQAAGEGTLWQQVIAKMSIYTEQFTGTLGTNVESLKKYLAALVEIQAKTTVPVANIESGIRQAELLVRQGEAAKAAAKDLDELAKAYVKVRIGIEEKGRGEVAKLEEEKKAVVRSTTNAANEARDRAIDEANKKRAKADELEKVSAASFMSGGPLGILARAKEATALRADADKLLADAAEVVGKAAEAAAQKVVGFDDKIKDSKASLQQTLDDQREGEKRDFAAREAEAETFIQKDIQRNQKRLENNMATAMAIDKAEQDIAKVRREQAGQVESVASQEVGFLKEREHSTGLLVAGLKAANAEYESQKRALEGLIGAGSDAIGNQAKLAELERSHADDTIERKNKIAQVTAELDAKEARARRQRDQEEIAVEERRLAHRVTMGRVSIQDQMESASSARFDPRRTAAQQEQAEEQLLSLKREYAERYFKLYDQLGASTWEGQLASAKNFLSQTVTGSRAWFDQVSKISDIYKGIYEQAKGIFSQEVGIAAAEAQREGKKTMRLGDVDKYVEKVRRRDEDIYRGGSGKIGDVTGAVSRRDLWQTVDREGLSPGQAWAKMQQSPQQQLTDTINSVATRQASVAETQVTATNQFAAAVDKFGAAVDRMGSGSSSSSKNDVNPIAPAEAPGSRGVLPSKGPRAFSNMMLSADTSSQLGRGLYLEGKRGPAATESAI